MKTALLLGLLVINTMPLNGQTIIRTLKVIGITKYKDGCLIKAIDTVRLDTVNLISVKKSVWRKRNYTRIVENHLYKFEYADLSKTVGAAPIETLSVTLKSTVVWTGRDDPDHMPAFLKNTKGLWIRKSFDIK
jgi:hypothetical protein